MEDSKSLTIIPKTTGVTEGEPEGVTHAHIVEFSERDTFETFYDDAALVLLRVRTRGASALPVFRVPRHLAVTDVCADSVDDLVSNLVCDADDSSEGLGEYSGCERLMSYFRFSERVDLKDFDEHLLFLDHAPWALTRRLGPWPFQVVVLGLKYSKMILCSPK